MGSTRDRILLVAVLLVIAVVAVMFDRRSMPATDLPCGVTLDAAKAGREWSRTLIDRMASAAFDKGVVHVECDGCSPQLSLMVMAFPDATSAGETVEQGTTAFLADRAQADRWWADIVAASRKDEENGCELADAGPVGRRMAGGLPFYGASLVRHCPSSGRVLRMARYTAIGQGCHFALNLTISGEDEPRGADRAPLDRALDALSFSFAK